MASRPSYPPLDAMRPSARPQFNSPYRSQNKTPQSVEKWTAQASPFERGKCLLVKENNARLRFLSKDEIGKAEYVFLYLVLSYRKLPLKVDHAKVEFSGIIRPGGSDEEGTFYGDPDHRDFERSGRRDAGEGDLPDPRDLGCHVLQLEIVVRLYSRISEGKLLQKRLCLG